MTRLPGHIHAELWSKADQHRFEDQINADMKEVEKAVDRLTQRVTLLMGAIGLLAFILPIAAPFIRSFLGLNGP